MIRSKRSRRIRRKTDWFSSKARVHFDNPLSRDDAERLVSDAIAIARHPFLPLIAFSKRERRYRRRPGQKKPQASTKTRELAYPSNRDGYIFAFYAEKLGALYEAELAARDLQKVVIGYRKGASNIRLARDAFLEIATRGSCAALALDISGFFDNISHHVLKAVWASLLNVTSLPEDHYAVFRALTRAAKIDRRELLQHLGIKPNARDRDLPRPLCPVAQFRLLRSSAGTGARLVRRHQQPFGIPQGTPLSAMAANIAMLPFDTAVHAAVTARGGSYRRYSDDILVVCALEHVGELERFITDALTTHTQTLQLNTDKREEARFANPGPHLVAIPPRTVAKPLQYLGFTFDGQRTLLRSGTLARFYRRMAGRVLTVKAKARLARQGKLAGRPVAHKRELLATRSHLGADNFVSRYAKDSARTMGPLGANEIRRQLARHSDVLMERLNRGE
jgi:RNA-directed DNA polymerase